MTFDEGLKLFLIKDYAIPLIIFVGLIILSIIGIVIYAICSVIKDTIKEKKQEKEKNNNDDRQTLSH